MDKLEIFLSQLVLKIVLKSAPTLSTDDQTKVTKAVGDFVATAMDLAAVYFALRAAKSTTK